MDAYKLCKLARKPTPRATRDIGAWYLAFSLTSAISVMTNCALLAMDKDVQVRATKEETLRKEMKWNHIRNRGFSSDFDSITALYL